MVHNPFLLEALLIGSIQQVQRDYGISAATPMAELDARLQQVLRQARSKLGS